MIRRSVFWMIFFFLIFFLAVFFLVLTPVSDAPVTPQAPTKEVRLPVAPTTVPFTPTPVIVPPSPTPDGPVFYTVQPGDTLSGIAAQFGFDVYDLAKVNGLTDINLIEVGQVVLLATPTPSAPPKPVSAGKQIIVVTSDQKAYAYEDGLLLKEFIVATGVPAYPTVLGSYAIYIKLAKTRMTGPGYDIPDVPWTMYFYRGYGLHGAPWNHHLGTPGSHGCVNLSVADADWLFHWAEVGTPVLILP